MSKAKTSSSATPAKKKIQSILITQPVPADDNNPYQEVAKKFKVRIDFRQFIQIAGIAGHEFRKQNVNPLDFTSIIFTSKHSIDHFFRILKELKMEMPADTKYFCVSEATAKYLQKYIVIRKRKLFVGDRTAMDLVDLIKKHKGDKYLFPCSAIHTTDLTDWMAANNFDLKKAVLYDTVAADVSDLRDVKYDMICFFSPSGVDSLFKNFPDFQKNDTIIGVFGPTTAKAAKEADLRVDIVAPYPNAPSMSAAIEDYLKQTNA
jgi:uroporphyrinogen-III synthase